MPSSSTPDPRRLRRWLIRIGIALGALVVVVVGGGALLIRCLNYWPDPLVRTKVHCSGSPARLRPGQPFKLLSWNLQFGAGRSYHFFYDGGQAVHASRDRVEKTLSAIGALLRQEAPDLLLLQEVDRDSARTARIDQLVRLRRGGPWACWTSCPYHRSRYVPAPLRDPLGRVDMHLATLSRYKLSWSLRRALPGLSESILRRAFNLKRAIQESAVDLEGRDKPLVLLNTHLSAFSYGDGTLARQLQVVLQRIEQLDRRGIPWILAGDLNMIPPGDDPKRLGKDARYYAGQANPLVPVLKRLRPAVSLEAYRQNPRRYYTYLPFGSRRPDRMIDYVFVSKDIEITSFRVLQDPVPVSDHLPLVLEARVK